MADTRINALSTATVSLSDDFLPIDGTTAGTKKLSAYNPSFGGNATVGGTLTVNGTTASVGAGTGSIISKLNGAAGSYKLSIYQSAGVDRWYAGLAAGAESGSDGGAPYSIVALTDAGAVIDNALLITRAAGGSITTPRPVSISATTASTSTSSGALVVGNGTSGGLGVGGAIFAGGNIQCNAVFAANSTTLLLRPNGASVSSGQLSVETSGNTTISAITDSTTKSDGALVVSGGVGVEKNIIAGSGIAARGTLTLPAAWTGAYGIGLEHNNATATSRIFFGDGTGYSLKFVSRTSSTTTDRMTLTDSGVLSVLGTTASTGTSSGALVVSGGVGVAGSINAGTTGTNHSHVFTGGDLGSGSTILVARDSNGTNQFIVGGSGVVQITNSLQLNGSANVLRIVNSQTPASASATGTAGTIAWDTSYIYVCTATNTWKRVAIATW
jgi:hypothetical protein